MSDESRHLRTLLESHTQTATVTQLELQDLKSKLTTETRLLKEREEADRLLTITHEKTLTHLTTAQHTVRQMEDEIELVRSELRGATGELVSFKDSLDSAENAIYSLQNEVQDLKAQVRKKNETDFFCRFCQSCLHCFILFLYCHTYFVAYSFN